LRCDVQCDSLSEPELSFANSFQRCAAFSAHSPRTPQHDRTQQRCCYLPMGWANDINSRSCSMNIIKVSCFAAVAGLLLIAAPAEHAQAASLAGPGVAAAVQSGVLDTTTEVHWRRGWHRHHRWHHRHHGWRYRHGHHRHGHHRHWRRW
jgi:hypothetical protein